MIAVHFWADRHVHVAQHRVFEGLMREVITESEMRKICDDADFEFFPEDGGPWRHRCETVRRAYNFYSPWSGFRTTSYYFEGSQFTVGQLMAETQSWIAFLDDLNARVHARLASAPDTVQFTTTNIFRSMLDAGGNMEPVIRLVKSLRVEFQGTSYILDPKDLQRVDRSSDATGPLRETAMALMREFERKEKLLTTQWNKKRGARATLTPRMVRRGFVTFMDGENQILARRVLHKTRFFAVRGVRYPISPDWQATNDFFICCVVKGARSPGTFYLLTPDLREPFLNAHTGENGVPCLGTAILSAEEDDPSPWETIFDTALAALGVINLSSLNDWQLMDEERIEHKIIVAAHGTPGWSTHRSGELPTMIRRGRLPFCDRGASPMEEWK